MVDCAGMSLTDHFALCKDDKPKTSNDVDFTIRKFAIWTHFNNWGQTRFFAAIRRLPPNNYAPRGCPGAAPQSSGNSATFIAGGEALKAHMSAALKLGSDPDFIDIVCDLAEQQTGLTPIV
jgi:hypothetical protein